MSRIAHPLTRPTHPRLRRVLPAPARATLAAAERTASDLGCALWLVGGGVRDLALGLPLHDLDLALDVPVSGFVEALVPRLRDVEVDAAGRFSTATLRVGEQRLRVDLARLRTEHYVTPGALPEVRPTPSIERDLKRRDFTVNAMALSLVGARAGELVDPFEGMGDLAARRLRVLHERSFVDDATRLWRGARTAALFRLEPDATTARLIEDGVRWLEPISGERLRTELAVTAERGMAPRALALLEAWGVLRGTHPALALSPMTARALGRRTTPIPRLELAAMLLAPLPRRHAILDRLAAPREWRTVVDDTARLLAAPDERVEALIALEGTREEARTAARRLDPERQPGLQRALRRWERTDPALDADALRREGLATGPGMGRVLAALRRARYEGTLKTPAAARRWLASRDGDR